jgi:hypothetical protein
VQALEDGRTNTHTHEVHKEIVAPGTEFIFAAHYKRETAIQNNLKGTTTDDQSPKGKKTEKEKP